LGFFQTKVIWREQAAGTGTRDRSQREANPHKNHCDSA